MIKYKDRKPEAPQKTRTAPGLSTALLRTIWVSSLRHVHLCQAFGLDLLNGNNARI